MLLASSEIAKGPEGYICIKANSMTEREVMDKLAGASRAGVQVQLILRGICCLRPGIAGQTGREGGSWPSRCPPAACGGSRGAAL